MIHNMDHQNEYTAKAIQSLQRPAYQVEAELIGFKGIPQLKESILEIQNCNEEFYGYMEADHLMGFISFKKRQNAIDIHRLVVDPEHFRKGIGRELVAFLLDKFEGMEFVVSTGKANRPAKNLYESFGFIEMEDFEVAPGIFCTAFEKRAADKELEE